MKKIIKPLFFILWLLVMKIAGASSATIICVVLAFEFARRAKKENSWINSISIKWLDNLMSKWNIKSNYDIIIILIVFSITGSIAVMVAKPALNLVGLDKEVLSPWIFWPIRIFIIFPIYQVLIVVVGALFGQFKFFWAFEKKMLARLGFKQFKETK
jgi:manganese efflux pump family protein